MKCVLIIAAVLCVMVAHVRSQGAGVDIGHGGHTGGGAGMTGGGNEQQFMKAVRLILARIRMLEKQIERQNRQSNNGIFGMGNGLSNYMVYEHMF